MKQGAASHKSFSWGAAAVPLGPPLNSDLGAGRPKPKLKTRPTCVIRLESGREALQGCRKKGGGGVRQQRASGRRAADTGSRRQRRRTARAPLRTARGKFDCASRI